MNESNSGLKKHPTIGVCGLDCGLCPRYYTVGKSKCPGCGGPDFFSKHPSCSFITCCVKKKNLEVCGECANFPCVKFKSAEEYNRLKESSSYPSHKKILPNLYFIKEQGIGKFVEQQNKRIKLLDVMLSKFDDDRSRSFFCRAATFHDLSALENAIEKAFRIIKSDKVKSTDMKSKAIALKTIIDAIPLRKKE